MRNNGPSGESVGEFSPRGVERAGGARGEALIERLREEIAKLEQIPVSLAFPPAPGQAATLGPACSLLFPPSALASSPLREPANSNPSPWGLPLPPETPSAPARWGDPGPVPSRGRDFSPLTRLEAAGLHEIKPETYADTPAALAFALALLGTRLAQKGGKALPLLWCLTANAAQEWGAPYGPGLFALGVDPAFVLIVEARTALDAAWALEEGLKARAFIAALGQIEVKSELMARRLGLAAQSSRTPCLLLSEHRRPGLPGTLTRSRLRAVPSREARFDRVAPGAPRWHFALERCRGLAGVQSWTVELCNDAYGVRLAATLADRAAEAGDERRALSG